MQPHTWWKEYGVKEWPLLARMGQCMCSRVVSAAPCESIWSLCALMYTPNRNRTKVALLSSLMKARWNLLLRDKHGAEHDAAYIPWEDWKEPTAAQRAERLAEAHDDQGAQLAEDLIEAEGELEAEDQADAGAADSEEQVKGDVDVE